MHVVIVGISIVLLLAWVLGLAGLFVGEVSRVRILKAGVLSFWSMAALGAIWSWVGYMVVVCFSGTEMDAIQTAMQVSLFFLIPIGVTVAAVALGYWKMGEQTMIPG